MRREGGGGGGLGLNCNKGHVLMEWFFVGSHYWTSGDAVREWLFRIRRVLPTELPRFANERQL